MKKKLSLLMVALVAVAAFAVQATNRATVEKSYTITFQETGTTSDASTKLNAIADIIDTGADYVLEISTATNVYKGREGRGIKLGTSKATGALTFTLAKAVKPTKITFKARKYNDKGEQNIIVNGNSFNELGELAEYTIEYDGNTEVTEIAISTSGESLTGSEGTSKSYRAYITEVSVFYSEEGDDPQPVMNTYTAKFENDGSWAEVYAYAWTGTEGQEGFKKYLGDWPGTKIEATEDGYVLSFEATEAPEKIIFNNNGNLQTADLVFEDGATYNSKGKVVQEPELNTYKVTFTTDAGWEKVYAYVWTDDTPLVEWPGTEITETLAEGVYTYTFEAAEAPTNIIFNDGGNNQTADLAFEDGKAYSFTTPKDVTTLDFASLDPASVESSLVGSYGDIDNYTIVDEKQGVKMLILKGSATTPCRFWVVNDALQLRAYAGASFTFEPIEEGKEIKKITFNSSTWGASNSTNVKELSGNEWTGSAAKVVLTIGAKTFVESITVEVGDPTTPEPTTFTATFTTNLDWEEVYAYAWSGEDNAEIRFLGDWPGTKLAKNAETGLYEVTIESTVAPEKIIFNNGIVGEGAAQTADLDFVDGKKYVYIASSADAPLTVAQAVDAIDAGIAATDVVFVEGTISKIDSYNEKYKSITYWISADGTTEGQQFEVYSGKGIDGADFESIDGIKVGAKVIVKGGVKKYGDIYEFDKNNQLVKYEAPVVLNTYTATFTTDLPTWQKVYAYAWSADGDNVTEFLGDWPGTELTATDGVYTVTIESEAAPEKIIFNNGIETEVKQQTADLDFVNGKAYSYTMADIALAQAKAALQEAIDKVKGYNIAALAEAIATAQAAVDAEDATPESIAAAGQTLEAAVKTYLKEVLTQAIPMAESLNVAELAESINTAKTALAKEDATVDELAEAMFGLLNGANPYARNLLEQAIEVANILGIETTDYQALLDKTEPAATTIELVSALNTLAEAAVPAAQDVVNTLEQYMATFDSEAAMALQGALTKLKEDIKAKDIIAVKNDIQTLMQDGKPFLLKTVAKLESYAEVINDENITSDVAAMKAAVEAENFAGLFAAVKKFEADFLAAAPGFITKVKTAATLLKTLGKTNEIEKLEAAIAEAEKAINAEDKNILTVGMAVRNLIVALKAYREANIIYTIAGTKDLTGTEKDWDVVEANNMTLDSETGLYTWTAQNVTVNAGTMPEFKVMITDIDNKQTWVPASDAGGDHNWVITPDVVGGEGTFTITITYNAKTQEIVVTGVSTPTGISSIKVETLKNAEIFNLAGQRVQNAQKGLYIVNGKKVVLK